MSASASKNRAVIDPHRPGGEAGAGARSADAQAILDAEQGSVIGAQDVVALGCQKAVAEGGQRQGGVRAAVAPAEDTVPRPHDEGGEEALAGAKDEFPGARIGKVGQGAEPGSGLRAGGIAAQGRAPKVAFQGRISTDWKRPARV